MRKLILIYKQKTSRIIPPEIHNLIVPVSTPTSLPAPK
jgi:hypothetical protein